MYQVCIFDLDGTLTDTLESLTYSVNKTLTELGLSEITKEQCKAFVGNGARYLIECALKAAGDENLTRIEAGMEAYRRIFGANCTYKVQPYAGVRELVRALKDAGVKLAVLSNKPHEQTKNVVAHFFGEDTFALVQGQQDGIPRKPDPKAALLIAERLGAGPERTVYVGDSEVDMETASRAGMESVGVTWGFRDREVLESKGAKHIIDYPEELILIVEQKE